MSDTPTSPTPHRWRFFRIGGFDQVSIAKAEDLCHLGELDQKLWSVLACPTSELEFDSETLRLLDTDGDQQIRHPEIIAATEWVCQVLKDPNLLFSPGDSIPLSALNTEHPEGASLAATAREVLGVLGRAEADAIALDDVADKTRLFPAESLNGDGILPAAAARDETLAAAITLIIDTLGSTPDLSGEPGLSRETLDAFTAQAREVLAWHQLADESATDVLPLGEDTAAAAQVFDTVRSKVDDYFTRCRLAAFDARAEAALNPADEHYAKLGQQALNAGTAELAELPLALAAAERPLPLTEGLNPAWATSIARLRDEVVIPALGERDSLSEADWNDLSARFAAYRAWSAKRPDTPVAEVDAAQLRELLDSEVEARLAALIEADLSSDGAAAPITTLERLIRYRRDLVTLLHNFVNLWEFYGRSGKAIFQAGTLYLDQRSCELVLRVRSMERHTALAPLSSAYLVYCTCTRQDEEPITIVAALTDGDADEMMVAGRNGVFYDRQGRDWSASVTQVVEAPISVRQAFWSPYKRVARMIGEQLQKFAASREDAVSAKAQAGIETGTPATSQAFDIAKFAGIFAAIGLAIGAIGTALAALIGGLLSLPLWQLPLVILGVMTLISGPSLLLAWLKLRRRNLGPLLDANGWAVNARARINLPFGRSLTGIAQLPKGSARSLEDPYADKNRRWPWLLGLLVIVALAALWHWGFITL